MSKQILRKDYRYRLEESGPGPQSNASSRSRCGVWVWAERAVSINYVTQNHNLWGNMGFGSEATRPWGEAQIPPWSENLTRASVFPGGYVQLGPANGRWYFFESWIDTPTRQQWGMKFEISRWRLCWSAHLVAKGNTSTAAKRTNMSKVLNKI